MLLYGKITKVDEDERIVEGIASSESVDSDGEVISTEAMKKASDRYMALDGGGNLREMHQPSAVGKVPEMSFEGDRTHIKAKVVDDVAWKKVKEKVYTGFSIGGKVVKKVGNVIKDLQLSEISLVDRPANPEARFSLVKVDDLQKDVFVASDLLSMATHITMLVEAFEAQGEKTATLKRLLKLLKKATGEMLDASDSEKVYKALDRVKFDNRTKEGKIANQIKECIMAKEKPEKKEEKVEEPKEEKNDVVVDEVMQKAIEKIVKEKGKDELAKVLEEALEETEEAEEGETGEVEEEIKEETEDEEVEEEEVEEADDEEGEESPEEEAEEAEEEEIIEEVKEQLHKIETGLSKVEKGILTKVEDMLKPLEDRLSMVEKVARQPKTRASFVVKRGEEDKVDNPELSALYKRKAELEKIAETDKVTFSKDYQQEANDLMDKINELER